MGATRLLNPAKVPSAAYRARNASDAPREVKVAAREPDPNVADPAWIGVCDPLKVPTTVATPEASTATPVATSWLLPPACVAHARVPSAWYRATNTSVPPLDANVTASAPDPNVIDPRKEPATVAAPVPSTATAVP